MFLFIIWIYANSLTPAEGSTILITQKMIADFGVKIIFVILNGILIAGFSMCMLHACQVHAMDREQPADQNKTANSGLINALRQHALMTIMKRCSWITALRLLVLITALHGTILILPLIAQIALPSHTLSGGLIVYTALPFAVQLTFIILSVICLPVIFFTAIGCTLDNQPLLTSVRNACRSYFQRKHFWESLSAIYQALFSALLFSAAILIPVGAAIGVIAYYTTSYFWLINIWFMMVLYFGSRCIIVLFTVCILVYRRLQARIVATQNSDQHPNATTS